MNVANLGGLAEVQARLNAEIKEIKGATRRGLILASVIIHEDTEKTPPLTPVDFGNLRASRFTVTADSVPRGRGDSQFKGPKAAKIAADHSATIMEGQGMIKSYDMSHKSVSLMMGYSAAYTLWVHENIGANFKRPGAGPKFFEASVKRNAGKVVQIIAANAKIK